MNKNRRISSSIEKFIRFLEKDRVNVLTAFLIVFLLAFGRAVIEVNLFEKKENGNIYWYTFPDWALVLSFFIVVFLAGTFIIAILSKMKIRNVVNVVLWSFWIVLLPPLIDYFIYGVRSIETYHFAPMTDVFSNISAFFRTFPKGLLIQGFIIMALGTFYVYWRSKSIMRTLLTPLSLFLIMALFGSMDLGDIFGSLLSSYSGIERQVISQTIGFELFFFGSIFLFAMLVDISNKKILPYLVISFRTYRALYLISICLIGIGISENLNLIKGRQLTLNYYDIPFIVLSLATIIIGWQFATLLNDYYNFETYKKLNRKNLLTANILTKKQFFHFAILTGIISFGSSILLGLISMFLTAGCILLAFLYSHPKGNIQNNVVNPFIFGLGCFFVYLIGYFATNEYTSLIISNYEIWIPKSTMAFTSTSIIIGVTIFWVSALISFFKKR